MSEILTEADFSRRLRDLTARMPPGERQLIALAGAPGSGKSTLAERLAGAMHSRLDEDRIPVAAMPMDGFHYDDILLDQLGRKARKGAPDTFDVGGLKATLERLSRNDEHTVVIPKFDRDLEIARAGAVVVPRAVQIVLVEGNYLLLNTPPWDTLAPMFDVTALIVAPEDELRRRLTARWEGYGLPPDEVRRKVEENDLPNGRMVMAKSRAPNVRIEG